MEGEKKGIDLTSETNASSSPHKSWFLGIGIDQYQHFSNLNNAVKDVKDCLALLLDKYEINLDCIITHFNEEATRKNIIQSFDKIAREINPNDKLLIYFSGHGHLKKIGAKNKGFWIPTDAEKDNTAQYIRNNTIREYIEDINSKHTLLLSDACFSGSLFVRGESRAFNALDELEQRSSRWAICSGRHDEEVFDGEPGTNSPFAASILDILGTNQNSKLNVAKLADQIIELTRANYKQLPEGNPLYGVGHKGGQYIFNLKITEQAAWLNAIESNSILSYQNFISTYPSSKFIQAAKQKVETLKEDDLWQKVDKENSLSLRFQYDQEYPNGRYVEENLNKIHELEDQQLWTEVKSKNSLYYYRSYTRTYPNGKFIEEANNRINELVNKQKQTQEKVNKKTNPSTNEEKPQTKNKSYYNWFIVVGLALSISLLLIVNAVRNSGQKSSDTTEPSTEIFQKPSFSYHLESDHLVIEDIEAKPPFSISIKKDDETVLKLNDVNESERKIVLSNCCEESGPYTIIIEDIIGDTTSQQINIAPKPEKIVNPIKNEITTNKSNNRNEEESNKTDKPSIEKEELKKNNPTINENYSLPIDFELTNKERTFFEIDYPSSESMLSGYRLLLGVFTNANGAFEKVKNLKKFGFNDIKVVISIPDENTNTVLFKVLVLYFDNKESAENYVKNLKKKYNMESSVLDLKDLFSKEKIVFAKLPTSINRYGIQVAAFNSFASVDKHFQELKRKGFKTGIYTQEIDDSYRYIYRVVIKTFNDKNEAEDYKKSLKARYRIISMVKDLSEF